MLAKVTPGACENQLWQTVLESVEPMELRPGCAASLRAWIAIGVERMTSEGRLTPEDLTLARKNLHTFIGLMKTEALYLGHADRLDIASFHAAHRKLEREAMLTAFALWPFWPNEFVGDLR